MKKRILSLVMAFVLICAMIVPAQAATASLSGGSSTVKPGDSVVITLSVSGGVQGFQSGAVTCSSNLKYENYASAKSDWEVDSNLGQSFLGYDKNVEADSGALMTLTFTVKSSAKEGDAISVQLADVILATGSGSGTATTLSWSGTVAAPPSTNCDLKGLECYNGTLSPAFDKNTTYYTVTVPYSTDKLNMDYFRADQGQSVSITGGSWKPALVVGENTFVITVKAASGATKQYTLVATRQQDPDYKKSTDATLKEMTIEGAVLSPAFDPAVTEYIAYVPFEQREVTLRGVPNDAKAVGVAEKKVELPEAENIPAFAPVVDAETGLAAPVTTYAAEDNVAALVCTAEDGVTQQTYTVHILRMPAYTGGVPQIHMTNEEDLAASDGTEVEEEIPEEEKPFEIPKTLTLPLVGEMDTKTAVIAGGAIVLVLLLLIGFLLGRIGRRKVYVDEPEEYEDEEEPAEEPAAPVMAEERPAEPAKPAAPVKPAAPAKPIKKEKPARKSKAFDFDAEEDEFERRLEQIAAIDHTPPVKEPEPVAPVEEAPEPVEEPEPAAPAAPAKTAEEELSGMSLDDLLNDIRNM